MTFEEFFIKKKIDLVQLQRTKPDLYEEFRGHYEQMGEKSFDHTKKYWFNRLRKDYLLTEPATIKTNTITTTTTTSVDISTPIPEGNTMPKNAPPTGFKPRFKPGAAKPATPAEPVENKAAENKPAAEETPRKAAPPAGSSSMSPSGFKPRFKPGVTKPAASAEPTKDPEQQKPDQLEKPAQTDEPTETPEQVPAKPVGFKPRFKPGVTKPAAPSEPRGDSEQQKPDQQEPPAQTGTQNEPPEQTPAKPLGFKPRFRPGITNKKNEDNE